MATIATLSEPYVVSSLEFVGAVPFGDLLTPYEGVVPDGVSAVVPSRFPVPPSAGGFLLDVDEEMMQYGVEAPYFITGAMYPESGYLEPTTGQIWPRG